MVFLTYLCQASRELKFYGRLGSCVDCLFVVVVGVVFGWSSGVGVVRCDVVWLSLEGGVCFAMYPFAVSISWNRGTPFRHLGGSCERSSMTRLMRARIYPNPCLHWRTNSGCCISFSVPNKSFLNCTALTVQSSTGSFLPLAILHQLRYNMSMSFGDFDIEILACNSTKIATPLLEVESGFRIFIVMVGIVLDNWV